MTTKIPHIIATRLAEAIVEPTIPRWRSLACMAGDMLGVCHRAEPTSPLCEPLRKIADFAYGQMRAMQPEQLRD